MRFAILGPGGVGGFLAAALARAGHEVLVVAREATAAAIERDGIELRSVVLGDFVARPRAAPRLEDDVDVLFVASKATTLQTALERIGVTPPLVIPMLNGLEHLGRLRARFGPDRVPAATIRIESDRPAPGRIVQTSPRVLVEVAFDDPAPATRLPPLLAALAGAGIPARIGTSERQVMWSKLARLNALSATTSAADRPIGGVRDDPEWRAALVGCVEETAAAANADGAAIDAGITLAEIDEIHPSLTTSMQRDLAAGRPTEVDAIQGAVIRAAARHGLSCPTVERLARQIEDRAGRGGRT